MFRLVAVGAVCLIFATLGFSQGQNTLDFGGYYVHSGGYRPQVIPTTPVAGLTLLGQSGGVFFRTIVKFIILFIFNKLL